jgi:hypothetical protein
MEATIFSLSEDSRHVLANESRWMPDGGCDDTRLRVIKSPSWRTIFNYKKERNGNSIIIFSLFQIVA